MILATAVEDGRIPSNPCTIKGAGVEPADERPIPTVAQVHDLVEQLPERMRCVVLLAAFVGLRRGEILGLRRGDIDLDLREIAIVRQRPLDRHGNHLVGPPKSEAGRRVLDIPKSLIADLRNHLDDYAQAGDDGCVFTGQKGGPLAPRVWQDAWAKARTEVGLPEIHLHDLRHLAGMLAASTGGTRALAPLLDQAATAGAKVVLVGDPKQLPEIEAGGFLRHLAQHHDVHTLTENRRQRVGWERDTISDLAHGRVDAALERMTANDGVVVGHNADLVRQRMADDWFDHRSSGASAVMMASRNSDVDDLNRRAHQLMADHGHLQGEPLHLDDRPFQLGDRVVCLRNDRRLDVRNGTVGNITHIDHQHRILTIDTPDGTRRLPGEYLDDGHVRHGYAVTIHKAQGITCDHALFLGSDELYRESGYVGLSRGRESNRIYAASTTPDPEAHIPKHLRKDREPLDVLTYALEQTRAQRLGIDHDAEPDVGAGL